MCEGLNTSAEYAGSYHGVEDCRAAHLVGQVDRMCSYGCIGLGTCLDACNFDAIEIYRGVARIIPENCVACEACVEACPREIIDMIPKGRQVFVPCKSFDAGKRTSRVCEIGCIGCKKCVKVCPSEAIGFDNNLAWIIYDKCTLCYECVEACPRHIIKVRDLEHYVLHESDLKQGFDRIAAAKRAEEQDRKAKEEKAKQEAAAKAGGEDPETAAKREKIQKSIADAKAKAEHDPEYATKLPKILAGFEKKLADLGPAPGEDPELAAKRQKIKQALADARKKAKEDPEYAKRFPKIEAGFMAKLEALDPSSKAAEHEAEKLGSEEVGE
jgi:Na+-translocating ferredoxin:NAD+ oxidoreductase RNF subunit RnfB